LKKTINRKGAGDAKKNIPVIPAKAGIQRIPDKCYALSGMTKTGLFVIKIVGNVLQGCAITHLVEITLSRKLFSVFSVPSVVKDFDFQAVYRVE
jgi:hypothetical protein